MRSTRAGGKRSARLSARALGAASHGDEIGGPARGAAGRDPLLGPAVVAAKAPGSARCRTSRESQWRHSYRLAAVVAEHDRREPAAVDEEEGLLSALEPFADGLDEPLGEAGRERQAPHVVERESAACGPPRARSASRSPPAPPGAAEVDGLQGGGRGAEHHRDPLHGAAHEGEVPGGVPESLLLLVGRVVLLVDDDEGRPAEGG